MTKYDSKLPTLYKPKITWLRLGSLWFLRNSLLKIFSKHFWCRSDVFEDIIGFNLQIRVLQMTPYLLFPFFAVLAACLLPWRLCLFSSQTYFHIFGLDMIDMPHARNVDELCIKHVMNT